jgi:predicted enzyme related to lactoylglutathione lyase
MERVTGIGGVFLKAKDPKVLAAWYQQHLGIPFGESPYVSFKWVNLHHPTAPGSTVFSFFKADTKYFQPSEKEFMINFRVKNLKDLLATLEGEGVQIAGEMEEFEYGKFGWIIDPEGNKIELWEPVDDFSGG